jgi:hypothetical protein
VTLVNADTGEVVAHSLAENEAVIEAGLATFVEVGRALMEIRDGRQYRSAGWSDFDTYCRERWGMARAHAYRMIEASEVVSELSPIGDKLPTSESQARELAPLRDDPEAMAEVMDEVTTEAEQTGTKVTATKIREKVTEKIEAQTPTIEQRWAAVLTLHPYLADIPTRYKAEALAGAEALTQFDTTERARREEIFQRWARSRPDAERASQQAEQHTKAEHAGNELLDAIAVCERSLDAWMARADQLPPGHDMPVHVAAAAADLTRRLAETAQTPHLRSVQ